MDTDIVPYRKSVEVIVTAVRAATADTGYTLFKRTAGEDGATAHSGLFEMELSVCAGRRIDDLTVILYRFTLTRPAFCKLG